FVKNDWIAKSDWTIEVRLRPRDGEYLSGSVASLAKPVDQRVSGDPFGERGVAHPRDSTSTPAGRWAPRSHGTATVRGNWPPATAWRRCRPARCPWCVLPGRRGGRGHERRS